MKKINEGYCAELFLAEDGKLLKLYKPGWSREEVSLEYKNTKAVNSLGIPSPQVYGIVDQDSRYGFWMEQVSGATMLQSIQKYPFHAFSYAKQLARLHFQIHQISSCGLPDQKEVYCHRILETSLEREVKDDLISMLDDLSDQQLVCHGDFHPMNILLPNGKPVVIDWAYTSAGDPKADVAGTYLIAKLLSSASASRNPLEKQLYDLFTPAFVECYLKEYLLLSGYSREEILKWVPLRAATYLDLGLPETINRKLFYLANRKGD